LQASRDGPAKIEAAAVTSQIELFCPGPGARSRVHRFVGSAAVHSPIASSAANRFCGAGTACGPESGSTSGAHENPGKIRAEGIAGGAELCCPSFTASDTNAEYGQSYK